MSPRTALFTSAALCATFAAQLANAQTSPTATVKPPVEANEATDIVVTGTRLLVNGNAAPSPLTVVGKDELSLAAPTSIADGLAQIPEFRSSARQSTFVTPQGPTGAFLNLRGLGRERVLVLLNGRRTVPTTTQGYVDVNTFPDLLVKRVDIVTGGASAAYGSDAVAGVVNFVLDEGFKGIKLDAGTGISSRGDNASYKLRGAYGTSFGDDRFHLLLSGDWFKSDGVLTNEGRDWDNAHFNVIANPTFATDGRTAFLWRSNVTGTQFATGGVITAGPLRGTQWLPGGVPAPFNYGTEVSAGTMVGGDGYWNPRGNISSPVTTTTLFGRLGFDATPEVKLWVEAGYSKTDSFYFGTSPSYSGTTAITVFRDNAFLDAATRARMVTANVQSFSLGRISPDWGRNQGVSNTELSRGAFGFDWDLAPGWEAHGAFDFGHTIGFLENANSPNQTKLFEALDAVVNPANGQIVCRSMLLAANANRSCAPLNPFGLGSASAAALKYVFERGFSTTTINQQNAELNVRGSPFSTWAGPVQTAFGYGWRRYDARQEADALSLAPVEVVQNTRGVPASLVGKIGVFLTGNQGFQPLRAITVNEGYVEAQVPLARDVPFLKSLDINGAVRYANYSTSGGAWTWKVGGVWEPFEGLRFRATRSRDLRAPNINDLFAPGLASLAPINDPVKGTNNNIPVIQGGNPNLVPEVANTLTAGAVLRPAFIPGFSLSVDYYRIKIGNAIGVLTAQNIVNLCANGNAAYCPLVSRLADGTLVSVSNFALNQNNLVDKGVDIEANYTQNVGDVRISIRALASYLASLATTDPFGNVDERAGVNGGEAFGTPHWQGSLSVSATWRDFTAFFQTRYIGAGLYSNQYVVGGRATNSIDYDYVPRVVYADLTLRQKLKAFSGEAELYLTVNNLFDRDPPPSPSRIGAPASIIGTNPTLYDVIGRQFNLGIRFKF